MPKLHTSLVEINNQLADVPADFDPALYPILALHFFGLPPNDPAVDAAADQAPAEPEREAA